MPPLSLREALQKSLHMYQYLAKHPAVSSKFSALAAIGYDQTDLTDSVLPHNLCFLCEYALQQSNDGVMDCTRCPLYGAWGTETFKDVDWRYCDKANNQNVITPYRQWQKALSESERQEGAEAMVALIATKLASVGNNDE